MAKHKRILQRILIVLSLLFFVGATAQLATAQSVTQGYQSDEMLQKGMIVRIKPGDSGKIEALTSAGGVDMLGVVVSASDAPVSLSNIGADKEVFVATFGRYDVLVSTQNGAIKAGDLVAVSSLAGVGMRADNKQEYVVGKALKDFDGRTNADGQTVLKTSNGEQTVSFGRVPVEIVVSRNPAYAKDTQPGVPQFLSRLVGIVTDRQISAFRIYASVIIMVISIIIAGVLLFTGVRTGMTAVGRNPLAKHSIIKSMVQVTLVSLIVFVIGVIAVYLLLRV